MRLSLLAVVLLATCTSVLAQGSASPPYEPPHPTGVQQFVAGLGGHFAGVAVGSGGGVLVGQLSDSGDAGLVTGLLLYPLGVAAATYGLGRSFGTEGEFGRTVRGTYLGAAVGAGVGLGLGAAILSGVDDESATPFDGDAFFDSFQTAFSAVLVGGLCYVAGTLVGANHGYRASIQPVALHQVGGAWNAGVRIRFAY